jgi:hypothetical protein
MPTEENDFQLLPERAGTFDDVEGIAPAAFDFDE